MKNGIDRPELIRPYLTGKRVGVLTNYTGVTLDFRRSVDILISMADVRVILTPEHGLYGAVQAGKEVSENLYEDTGIPIFSTFSPGGATPSWADKIDILVYDIQDIGLRFYTYIYTLSDAMKICAGRGIEVLVLDRYNPLGLTRKEGTMLERKYSSFVGRYPIPSRYALTVGELARYFNEEEGIGCSLAVVPCQGLARTDDYESAGVPWIPTSPNCPTMDSVLCYAGTVLVEGTNLSEGRGTTKPFEVFGAPYLRARELADRLNEMQLPGVFFRYHPFIPSFSKYKNEFCQGVMLHILDKAKFRPFETGLRLIAAVKETNPEFSFTCSGEGRYFIDYLLGTDELRQEDFDVDAFLKQQEEKVQGFDAEKYYLYK